jgi:hypothetical protein
MGQFHLVELPFLLLGFIYLWRWKKVFWLMLGWLLITPIPAAVAGRPFAVRSLAMLPVPFYIVSFGLVSWWRKMSAPPYKQYKSFSKNLVKILIVVGFGTSIGYYLVRYHLEYPTYAATWWGWENKAAIDLAIKEEKKYEQVFISNFYTGAELALAYYTNFDPLMYLTAKSNPVTLSDGREFIKLGKFYIGSLDLDRQRLAQGIIPPRTLYIGRPEEAQSQEVIRAPSDGRELFYIFRTDESGIIINQN